VLGSAPQARARGHASPEACEIIEEYLFYENGTFLTQAGLA
jgi:hypothetical protein